MKKILTPLLFITLAYNYSTIFADECKKGNCKNGNGTLILSNGQSYTGEFKNSKFDGKGILIEPSGHTYEGEFKNGQFEGQGKYTGPDGKKTVGVWKDGKPVQRKDYAEIKQFLSDSVEFFETQINVFENAKTGKEAALAFKKLKE